MCYTHTVRRRKGLDMDAPIRDKMTRDKSGTCSFDGCNDPISARNLCAGHWAQANRGIDLKPKRPMGRRGEWGAWNLNADGYVRRNRLVGESGRKYQYQLQHRVVMEEHLGRPLEEFENIHHIDGNRANNDLPNLELWVVQQPPGQRATDKVAWALEMLRHYAPETLSELGLDTSYEPPLR